MLSSNDLDQYAMCSLTIFAPSPLLSPPDSPSDPWPGLISTGLTTSTGASLRAGKTGGWSVWVVTRKNLAVVYVPFYNQLYFEYTYILVIAEAEMKKINTITTFRYYEMIRNTINHIPAQSQHMAKSFDFR